MGFAFEHRGPGPERTFRNDRYSDFRRGPVYEDPRVTEEREMALMRAATADWRAWTSVTQERPALAAKLNGPEAAPLVLQRTPMRDAAEPELVQRQAGGHTEGDCWDAWQACLADCDRLAKGNRQTYRVCEAACMDVFARCRSEAEGRRILDDMQGYNALILLAVLLGLVLVDGPFPAGDALAAMIFAYYVKRQSGGRRPGRGA
jgi:hypothetical protein